jgi:hypothetical protein
MIKLSKQFHLFGTYFKEPILYSVCFNETTLVQSTNKEENFTHYAAHTW